MDLNKYLETERRTKNLIRFLTALSVLSLFVAAGKERMDPSGASAVLVCSLLLLVFCGWMLWKTRPGREVYENAEFY